MPSLSEIEELALALSEDQRATLAATLIESLSNTDPDEDVGKGALRFNRVRSSMLRRVRYDPKHKVLDVVFRTGETYRYKDVPVEEYNKLMKAKSHGKYMRVHIIDHYEVVRLDD
jgi:hypothetical protein